MIFSTCRRFCLHIFFIILNYMVTNHYIKGAPLTVREPLGCSIFARPPWPSSLHKDFHRDPTLEVSGSNPGWVNLETTFSIIIMGLGFVIFSLLQISIIHALITSGSKQHKCCCLPFVSSSICHLFTYYLSVCTLRFVRL